MSHDSKRYTEREFSLILAKAAEISGSSSAVDRVEAGLTIDEIMSIAAEVGLRPDSIVRAARLVPDERPPSLLRRFVGGSFRVRRTFTVPEQFDSARAQRVLGSARRTMQTNGDGDADASGVSWSTRKAGQVFVSAHGEGAETRVQVVVDNRAALAAPLFWGTAGLVVTLYTAIAVGDSGLVDPYLVLTGGGGAIASWVWSSVRRIAGRTRATVENLVEAIGDAVETRSPR
jgi:hypothetical protein